MVPPDNLLVLVEHRQAVVERLQDVVVELAHPPEFLCLQVQLPIQAAVLDRGGHLARHSGQQGEILAVERLVGLLAPERQHRDGRAFEDTRYEVVDAVVAPELDLLRLEPGGGNRIVERDRVVGVEPRKKRRGARQSRHGVLKPEVADRVKVSAALVGEHQRHLIDDQRLDHARDEPLAEPHDVEVAVQIPRETNQRAAIVVAVAVEDTVQRILHRLLDRLREQHHDHRGQGGHDPVVRVRVIGEKDTDRLAHRQVQQPARAQEGGVRKTSLDNDFNVAQAVPDNGRRKGKRHEPERDGGQLQRERRVGPQRPRQCVEQRVRPDAQHRPPRDPAKLPASGQRGDLAEAPRKHNHGRSRADEKVDRLETVQRVERSRQQRAVRRAARHRGHAACAKDERRSVHR